MMSSSIFDAQGLKRGEEITPSLSKAIKESQIAIVVFSEDYASSAYCLDELVLILQCSKEEGRFVLPIFYDIEPSQVRHQKGSYGKALAKHEKRYSKEKLQLCKNGSWLCLKQLTCQAGHSNPGTLQKLFNGLNLSANGLTGEIPIENGRLKELRSLDLSFNNLTGSTDALEDLVSLIEVNISYNIFNGTLPKNLMKLLTSSPSSFMANPHLCVSCSPSQGLNCTKTSYLKACVYKSTDHIGISKFEIVMTELGSSIFVSAMLIALIHTCLHRKGKHKQEFSLELRSSIIKRGAGKNSLVYENVAICLAENQLSSLHAYY